MASLDDEEVVPETKYIKLVSKEGHEFVADRAVCMASGTIRTLITGPGNWKENEGSIPSIEFEEISTKILEQVLRYFYYKARYDRSQPPLPNFDIDVENIVPLLLAANFLDT